MIEIPDVEQWTYGKIIDLVNEGYDEVDILEESLTHLSNEEKT